jgi:hypothetical protein
MIFSVLAPSPNYFAWRWSPTFPSFRILIHESVKTVSTKNHAQEPNHFAKYPRFVLTRAPGRSTAMLIFLHFPSFRMIFGAYAML